jgi:hypothetical protein
MEEAALSKFDESALLHGAETLVNYKEVMRDITYYVFPATESLQNRSRRGTCAII